MYPKAQQFMFAIVYQNLYLCFLWHFTNIFPHLTEIVLLCGPKPIHKWHKCLPRQWHIEQIYIRHLYPLLLILTLVFVSYKRSQVIQMTEAGLRWEEITVLVNGKSSHELQPPSSHGKASVLPLFFLTLLTLPCILLSLKYTAPSSTQSFSSKCPLMTGNTCSHFIYTWIISLKCLLIHLVELVKWFLKYEAVGFSGEAKSTDDWVKFACIQSFWIAILPTALLLSLSECPGMKLFCPKHPERYWIRKVEE